jgi:hypothetical protein
VSAEDNEPFEEGWNPLEEVGRKQEEQGFGGELRPGGPSESSGFEKGVVEPHG